MNKIETSFKQQGYKILYEKGTFQSGYCIVNNSKNIVINKFFDTQSKINTLLEIAEQLDLTGGILNQSFLKEDEN